MLAPPANSVNRSALCKGVGPPTKSLRYSCNSARKSGSSLISSYASSISPNATERVSGMNCPPNFPNLFFFDNSSKSSSPPSGTCPNALAWFLGALGWTQPAANSATLLRTASARSSVLSPAASKALRIALPTTTPSPIVDTCWTIAGVEIPNPTAKGNSVLERTRLIKSSKSSGNSFLVPVTPVTDTQYINVEAALDKYSMRSSELVGATIGTLDKPCFLQDFANSCPSSGGKSTTMNPSASASWASLHNFSKPYCKKGL
mmetsp:Transcript_30831/g.47250  ORF Transcript_30831/g.47250 Transcript_30831/m.47250 type:complete len:261 (-) Transcript_30831:579-1361(-)